MYGVAATKHDTACSHQSHRSVFVICAQARDAAHQLAVLLHENRKLGTHPAAVCCMHAYDDDDDRDTAACADNG